MGTSSRPWQSVHVDYYGPLWEYVLVCNDRRAFEVAGSGLYHIHDFTKDYRDCAEDFE